MNYIILKYFYRKPEEILSFLMTLDENPNFSQKFVKNLQIKVQNFFYFFYYLFLFYLTCFTTVPIFKSISPLVAEIWGGGAKTAHPQWTQVLKITQWD